MPEITFCRGIFDPDMPQIEHIPGINRDLEGQV